MATRIRLRPEVKSFAESMELNLRRHDATKGGAPGWRKQDTNLLYVCAKQELFELASSILEGSPSILNEAADCANFLMMICDKHNLLVKPDIDEILKTNMGMGKEND